MLAPATQDFILPIIGCASKSVSFRLALQVDKRCQVDCRCNDRIALRIGYSSALVKRVQQ
jgi:hypothetical protein